MTLRIPKPNTGSAWSRNYWNPPEHPAVPLLLSLRPATRRWLFGVPGAGVGFHWTLPSMDVTRDTEAAWETGPRWLTANVAIDRVYMGGPLPDDADVDRALWLPENPWAVLETIGKGGVALQWRTGHTPSMPPYFAQWAGYNAGGDTAIEAVLKLADLIIGGVR